jgi:hypothetical protein
MHARRRWTPLLPLLLAPLLTSCPTVDPPAVPAPPQYRPLRCYQPAEQAVDSALIAPRQRASLIARPNRVDFLPGSLEQARTFRFHAPAGRLVQVRLSVLDAPGDTVRFREPVTLSISFARCTDEEVPDARRLTIYRQPRGTQHWIPMPTFIDVQNQAAWTVLDRTSRYMIGE